MSEVVVEISALSKRFGPRDALKAIDLQFTRGRIVAVAGPNGSGKTTLLRLMAGFLAPTSGTIRVFGLDPRRHRDQIMASARFAFAPPALYEQLTGRELLRSLASLRKKGEPTVSDDDIEFAICQVGLTGRADDLIRVYSFGMRQRLALAQALMPIPKLLVLDEPTDGLDPIAVLELREILRGLRDQFGVTILLSSHLLSEVEQLVDELVLLHEGEVLFSGAPEGFISQATHIRLEFNANGNLHDHAVEVLQAAGHHAAIGANGGLTLPAGSISLQESAAILSAAHISLTSFHEEKPSLERAILQRLRAAKAQNNQGSGSSPPRSDSTKRGPR